MTLHICLCCLHWFMIFNSRERERERERERGLSCRHSSRHSRHSARCPANIHPYTPGIQQDVLPTFIHTLQAFNKMSCQHSSGHSRHLARLSCQHSSAHYSRYSTDCNWIRTIFSLITVKPLFCVFEKSSYPENSHMFCIALLN